MLWDPKKDWVSQTAPTLRGFIRFLETMPPRKHYDWTNLKSRCPVWMYFETLDATKEQRDSWWKSREGDHLDTIAMQKPRTYGALLKRARAAA